MLAGNGWCLMPTEVYGLAVWIADQEVPADWLLRKAAWLERDGQHETAFLFREAWQRQLHPAA